jgi:hypothetical protein
LIGNKTLSTIREELRSAFAEEGANPIAGLDRKIRKLKNSKSAGKGNRSLIMLRNALAQLVAEKPRKRKQSAGAKRTKRAV